MKRAVRSGLTNAPRTAAGDGGTPPRRLLVLGEEAGHTPGELSIDRLFEGAACERGRVSGEGWWS